MQAGTVHSVQCRYWHGKVHSSQCIVHSAGIVVEVVQSAHCTVHCEQCKYCHGNSETPIDGSAVLVTKEPGRKVFS